MICEVFTIPCPHCWLARGSRLWKAYLAMSWGLAANLEEVHWGRAMTGLCRDQECCVVVDHVRQLIHRGWGSP